MKILIRTANLSSIRSSPTKKEIKARKKLQHYQYSGNELSKQQQRKTHENGRDNFNNIISRASIFCLHYFATV